MRIVIQDLVLGGGEGGPAGGEGRTVRRPRGAGGAAGIPPGASACLALALILLSPTESHRPPPAASALGTQQQDAHRAQDHQKSPDHIRCDEMRGAH